MAYFYEIRSADNAVLKRTGGFPDREAATIAAREDAKKLRTDPKLQTQKIGKLLVGQNMGKG